MSAAIATESNVVDFREVQRRTIDRRHASRQNLVEWVINQANCDVEDLYGASAADVTNVSLAIADLIYPIGDHDGSEYPIANEEVADEAADESAEEQLAGFIAAVAGDALRLEHATDPTFNANEMYDECLIRARRIVATYF
jgi:hypothetical protein